MRSDITGPSIITDALNSKASHKPRRSFRQRQALMAAACALMLANSALGQIFFDTNGNTSGLGTGTGTWAAMSNGNPLADWATSTAGTTDVAWIPGDVANFNVAFTVNLLDAESIGGLSFNTGATTITTTAGTTGEALDIGSSTYNATAKTGGYSITLATGAKEIIAVPIVGSGDLVLTSNQSNNTSDTIDLAGNLNGFTGNIYMNNTGTTTLAQYQIDSPTGSVGGVYGTIYLANGVGMTSNNQVGTSAAPYPGTPGDYSTGTLVQATPNIFTLSNPIVLNYNNVTGAVNNTIGAPNGPTISGVKYQKIITYAGAISGTAGLTIGGTNGTTVLSGNNTYTGTTYAAYSDGNGFLQLGSSTALPATTVFVFGNNSSSATGSVGPLDVSGNNVNIAGLQTGSSGTTAIAVGNIYNLSIVNTSYPVMANGQPSGSSGVGYQTNPNGYSSTITIMPASAEDLVYNGDIGDSNVAYGTGGTVAPFTNNAPYSDGAGGGKDYVQALTNISLVLNGPTSGVGNSMLTLAPIDTYSGGSVTGLVNGNEYTGTTTINSNATLVLGRGFDKTQPASFSGGVGMGTPPENYTITGSGNVTVNSGGTLASLGGTFVSGTSSGAGYSIGGAAGTIILNSGSSFLPGEGLITGSQGAKATTTTLSPNNVGTFTTNAIQFNAGASMTFSIANAVSYDYVYLEGNLSLDDPSNSNHTINIDVTSTGSITPGVYTLVNAAEIDGTPSSYTLNTSSLPAAYANDIFSLGISDGNFLQLNVQAPLLQWDPSGTGASNHASGGDVTEQGGEWTDGNGSDGAPATTFYNQLNGTETTWSNTSTYQVLIGNDASQHGGVITLGNNIVASSGIFFGPIAAGFNYSIAESGSNAYTLTVGSGGIQVANGAATSTTPSAEIDVPVVLSASQTWNVLAGQFLNVTGAITQSTSGTTLTFTGGGDGEFSGANGNISTVAVTGGSILLLDSATAIGSAVINLNNGGLQYTVSVSPTNTLTIGTSGGEFGATTGVTVTYAPNISTSNGFEAIGTGTTIFNGTVATGALQVSAASGSTLGTIHFSNNVTVSGNLSVTSGNAYFDAVTSITGTSSFTGGNAYLDNPNAATTPNTFTGGITIQGGTVYAQSSNALGNATITFPGSPAGGLDIAGAATLSNPINGTGSGAGAGGNSFGDTIYLNTNQTFTLTGATEGSGDIRWYADPNNANGATPELILNEASQRPQGGAVYFNINNLDIVIDNGLAMGLSTQAFMQQPNGADNYTLDVEAPVAYSGDLRGEPATGGTYNTSTGFTITKTGPGLLSLGAAAASGYVGIFDINQGELETTTNSGIGGTAAVIVAINVTGSTSVLGMDLVNGTKTGGSYTLSNGGTLRRDNTFYSETITAGVGTIASNSFTGETDLVAATASDVITAAGTGGTIEDGAIEGTGTNLATTNCLFTVTNPIVVDTGATLNLQNDNPLYNATTQTGGNDTSYILGLRGPTGTSTAYDTLTIQAGAKVANTGPGQLRFGRTNSQGVPIIGQGTPGSEAILVLGSAASGNDDVYMTDNNTTAGEVNTVFIVEGTGTAGLRIVAPMDATYEDPTSANANTNLAEGTTGFFGINTTETASGTVPTGYYGTIGNAYTVMTPNRLAALSTVYTVGATTITPSGTLTLAANDQGNATGTILGGPAAACAVTLALDNTPDSTGTHIYQINPAANSAGGLFSNFAGLTVERSSSGAAAVTAQLLGNTKVPVLSITGGAKVDITNQALVVDPATGPAPTAQIAAYLASAYDNGNWDRPGIGSSSVPLNVGTSIGYAENDLLPTPYNSTTNIFGGAGGQPISDSNAVLVRYTYLGDLNLDGTVTSADLAMMGDGQTGWIGGDLNYDGVVNADDFALFDLGLAAYNASGQATINSMVPEPATMSLLAIGAGAMLRRRRR
jgi:hypothetical protein